MISSIVAVLGSIVTVATLLVWLPIFPGSVHLVREPGANLARFVVPEQPVVDEDARQPIADGPMNQQRGYGRIDAAG